ncbi:hypothetical protein E8D34_13125 [Nocardioides sp. GY 10113]|uniref:hypothetical protein n=1 Tax=Nocardioides sp. GY 10113 TaxID=2569761 RepID=UPI0010A8E482|nr:hypothetical protein [Nocardioides sp. GY 10113]TIC85021.1 hypothetical protein E8D34_13125 [Nocardioides sp. GY 10113]
MKIRALLPALLAAALLQAPVVAPAGAADGRVQTATACDPARYRSHYRVEVATTRGQVTHLRVSAVPPHGSRVGTLLVPAQDVLTATVRFRGGRALRPSGAAAVLDAAASESGLRLRSAGSTTLRHAARVRVDLRNTTTRNQAFPVFRGNMVAAGSFRRYSCRAGRGANAGAYVVTYREGRWRSFGSPVRGWRRCGQDPSGPIAAAAVREGCA